MGKHLIYALRDPNHLEVRYVGQSSRGMVEPKGYLKETKNPTRHVQCWVNSLLLEGVLPEITVLQKLSSTDELDDAEIFWIAHYRFCGNKLTNHTDGGGGARGFHPSEKSRKKMREAKLGTTRTEQTKKKISQSIMGVLNGNTNGSGNKGRTNSDESRANIAKATSEAIKRWWSGEKTIRCLNDDMTFVTMAEASRHYGISLSSVSRSLLDGSRRAGYRFTRLQKG